MADLSNFLNSGGAGFRLAPDLTWPSIAQPQLSVVLTATPLLYTTALSLTGKFAIGLICFENLTSEPIDFRLTIDGVVIWDDAQSSGQSRPLLGDNTTGDRLRQYIICKSSLLLEIRTTTDTSVQLFYDARPIL
jgi:hypothetical protein